MVKILLIAPLLMIIAALKGTHQDLQKIQITGFAQGTSYHITYYASDSALTQQQADSIFLVMDSSMSLYKPWSLINRFNQADQTITADRHLAEVVSQSLTIYKESGGVFDITVQPLVKAWGFGNKTVKKYPSKKDIRRLLKCVGSDKISLRDRQLSKTTPCTSIDVNGIAQGYTVDLLATFLEQRHVGDYLVEVGGEIRVRGKKPDGTLMKIGIEAPGSYENEPSVIQKIIALDNGAVTTSGNYRKFHESRGKKFSHIIDPRTGYPIRNEIISVTVIAKDALTADGYDNVLMALGLEKAFALLEHKKDMAAYFIYRKTDGSVGDTASTRFQQYFAE